MGIKGLPNLINKVAGDYAVGSHKLSKFKNMKVAVDANLLIHKTVIAMRTSGRDMTNREGELTSHLYGIFYKILMFLENGIRPIFVFDGKPPNIKQKTIDKRTAIKKKAEENMKSEKTKSKKEEYIKSFKQSFKLSKEHIDECQILLDIMGIPYINAPGEADVVCSWLATRIDPDTGKRYAKGVCSDDSDMLALGAPYLFLNMTRFMNSSKTIRVVSLNRTLVKLNLTYEQFVDMCVLCGCDYCDNIPGLGPMGALKLMRQEGDLAKAIKVYAKKHPDVEIDNKECLFAARDYFKTATSELDKSDDFSLTEDNLELREYQYEELVDFMVVKHNFDIIRVQNGITRLKKYHSDMKITRKNTKKVHKIIQPRSENYMSEPLSISDYIEFLSEDSSDSDPKSNKKQSSDSSSENERPSKATKKSATIRR